MQAWNQYAVIWQSYALYLLRPFGIFKIRNIEVEISLCLCRSGALEGGSGKNDLAKVSVNLCDLAAFKGRVRDLAEHIVTVF